jgi:hypothetical protein
MASRKTLIIVAGNPMWIDAEAGVPTSWRVWLAAIVFTVCGLAGFMALFTWLLG